MSTHDVIHDDRPKDRHRRPSGSVGGTIDEDPPQTLSPNQLGIETSNKNASGPTGAFPAAGDMVPNLFERPPETETSHSHSRSRSRISSTNTAISRVGHEGRDSTPATTTSTVVARPDRDGRMDTDTDTQPETVTETGTETDTGTVEMPPTTRTVTGVSGKPYSAFSSGTRWLIVTLAGIAAVFSPIRSVKVSVFLLSIRCLSLTSCQVATVFTSHCSFPHIPGSLPDVLTRP